jgi:hypothetical protein
MADRGSTACGNSIVGEDRKMAEDQIRKRIVGFDCAEELHEAVLLDESGEQQTSMSVVNQVEAVENA